MVEIKCPKCGNRLGVSFIWDEASKSKEEPCCDMNAEESNGGGK